GGVVWVPPRGGRGGARHQSHRMYRQPPIRSLELTELAGALLGEAGHLLGNEQMEPAPVDGSPHGTQLRNIELNLRRARRLLDQRPGTSYALALQVLGQLDALARAREAATRGW
ncbi:hypothetical protein ACFW7O_01680, partial [Streptomyces diastatochromogenes]